MPKTGHHWKGNKSYAITESYGTPASWAPYTTDSPHLKLAAQQEKAESRVTNWPTSEKAGALEGDTRKAGTLQFKQMAEGDISDACKTVKAADEKNADQVFHKSYNTRHQEDLVNVADQLQTNEGVHCLQVNI